MRLTRNFDSGEFDVNEKWPEGKASNRLELAVIAQALRDLAESPVIITSASRSPERNELVGGVESSQHLKQEALDGIAPACPLRVLAERVLAAIAAKTFPKFGQIIFYVDRGHIHWSLPTLGARNGEVRYSYVEGGTRHYPLLVTAKALPLLSDKQKQLGLGAVALVGVLGFALFRVVA